jgi:protein phosphatase
LKKRGKLTDEQAEEHPQRSVITRALGPFPTVEVDTWTYPVREGDVLLLCSDGLTSMVGEERISEIIASSPTLNEAARRLIHEANEAGGRDNITVVLFRLEEVDGAPATDDATMIGASAVQAPAEDTLTPSSSAMGAPTAGTATASAPAGASQTTVRPAPLARTQGRPVPRTPSRRPRRYSKPVAALLATLIVLFLLGAGGYLATRQLYFIGTNPQGIVTIYRGLPYDLPAGIRLYETYYVSGVPASLVPADRRGSLFNDDLRSQTSAQNLVRDLELGKVAK